MRIDAADVRTRGGGKAEHSSSGCGLEVPQSHRMAHGPCSSLLPYSFKGGEREVLLIKQNVSHPPDETVKMTAKEICQGLGLNINGTCLQSLSARDLTNIGNMSTHSNKGTQAGKSQLDKAVLTPVNPTAQESEVYSLDNLFTTMSSVCNIPLVTQDAQNKEPALNRRVAPFPIFLPKDHLSTKLMERNEIEVEKGSKSTKIRGEKGGGKRNRRISKKKARKVKFEEREQVKCLDASELVPLIGNFQSESEETIPVLQQMPDMGSSRDFRQTHSLVIPSVTF
ncbi:hypothetical protein NDU88_005585 [Pleurodeles waltl]|uniref:Uncharacterized protein n=1 Tax=Pleurodeles waltl TaxID=8319 RepID=A0AAV7WV59_PLEWA|nr:hypothetical protein NDU88_005585 [Pleurodeles waltl]